jgi:hypothetical protein
MSRTVRILPLLISLGALSLSRAAWAQSNFYPASSQRARRPFRASYQMPAVSPYVNLLRDDMPAIFNYYTLVKPQLEQEAFNARERAGIGDLQQQLALKQQALRQQSRRPRAGGHVSRFMDYSDFYFRKSGPR